MNYNGINEVKATYIGGLNFFACSKKVNFSPS